MGARLSFARLSIALFRLADAFIARLKYVWLLRRFDLFPLFGPLLTLGVGRPALFLSTPGGRIPPPLPYFREFDSH